MRIFDPKAPREPETKPRRRRPLVKITLYVLRPAENGDVVRIPIYERPGKPAIERRTP